MKVLIGMTRSDTIVSGSFKHICQIAERFKNEGADVFFVLGGDGAAIQILQQKGYKVYSLNKLHRNLSLLNDIIVFFQLLWIILKERPNVCSWHTAKIGALGRVVSTLSFRKSFYVPHGVPFVNTPENKGYKVYERLEKILAWLPSKIICVCDFDRNEYLRIGVPSSRLKVILNGMVGKRRNGEREDGAIKFISAARFEPQKDYRTLAYACNKLWNEGFKFSLDIYGDGALEAEVRDMFSEVPSGIVNFCGVVDNFADQLVSSDVFVLSSFWEGLPRSIIEAMACGVPIIASDVGGCSELVLNDVSGYLIPVRDGDSMYSSMKMYICNHDLLEVHGERGYRNYIENYTLNRMLECYVREYGIK